MATYIHPELRNIAGDLDDQELSTIANDVCESYAYDNESRGLWSDQHALWLKLFHQKDEPVNRPWRGSADESMPMLAEACIQFHSRAFKAMFPSRTIIKGIQTGEEDSYSKERAERVSKHMSWQLLVKDKSYKRNKSRLLLSLPLHGSAFTKTFYDPVMNRNVTKNVRATDLVIPYGIGPREIEEIDRKTEIIWMSVDKSRWLAQQEYFIEECEPYTGGEKQPVDDAEAKSDGIEETSNKDDMPCMVLEQHRLLDLDDSGFRSDYIVTVDYQARKVLRIAIRWETDEAGYPIKDKFPVEHYTHYAYIENPEGFYGLGHGHMIGQLNSSVNKLLRQTIDAGTLANAGNHSGFISGQLAGIEGGELEISLGKFKKLQGSAEDIKRSIYKFDFPGPSNVLMQIMQMLMMRADRLATVTEAITGQTESVMQPTALLALIEQSLQVFSTAYEQVYDSWSNELGKHFSLNYKHMDPQEYFSVLDVDGGTKSFETAREDYNPDMEVIPMADPKMVTEQQKLTRAQMEWQFLSMNALVQQSPQHYFNASRRFMEAMGSQAIDEVLPNPNSMLPRVDDPNMENMAIQQSNPMMPMAYPDQDHALHLQTHMTILKDPESKLSDLGRKLLDEHVRAHGLFMFGMGGNGAAGAGGDTGMANAPNNSMGVAGGPAGVPGADMESGGYAGQTEPTAGAGTGNRVPGESSGQIQ